MLPQPATKVQGATIVATGRKAPERGGYDLYLSAMWEEAQETGDAMDWDAMDELWQDAKAVDAAQGEQSDWRWA